MKLLNLHVDYIKFKPLKKALKKIEDLEDKSEKEVRDALVVLIAVEKGDEDVNAIVKKFVESVEDVAGKVNAKNMVLYPYAHLSSNLASPDVAMEVLKEAEKALNKKKYKVVRAPFGYYKEFEMKVKGHPLSELSREIKLGGKVGGNEEIIDLSEKERNKLLHEISKAKLDTSKLRDNDHRILGRKMDLWSFNNVAPGMVFWHSKGLHIKNKLIEFWREMHKKEGYKEISTPQIMDRKLWEVSGHWSKYSENNFKTEYENRDFLVKPMNCPGGMLVYNTSPKSYKDFPLKVGELGWVHRIELSGVLAGLFRVIQFVQDDAHIFCTLEQAEEEIAKVIDLTKKILDTFKLKIDHVELSTRPEKRIGTDKEWDFAERTLEKVLKKKKMKYKINKGDGAFYGAKIDYHLKDSLGRTWQCSTIQFDMSLPRRFKLTYTAENGEEKMPVMLHRTIYGSLERFLGVYTEHVDGKFPLWISPNQIKVMTLNDSVKDYAQEVFEKFKEEGFEIELDDRAESIGKKARDAQIQRFNYLVTVGEKEATDKKIAVKKRDEKEINVTDLDEFISKLKEEIVERK
ncbi:threonine--tRNA ligase [archaeon]|jgi:threonyl-tRNA synthetase|nr:threonine--tRNA ligase [archaeon]MBT4374012.1 threonine--tRNA ligase [archaeon]MBT4532108.1 threonine--tRNA ligase [archaeon]MBT7001998.1 threonine--tRNA ligase [archaeon]MBT7282709.1 threonine--tRNA ligase [archaeon]